MTIRIYVKSILLSALILLSLGGFFLHTRVHPISQNSSNLIPAFSGILSIIVIPLLFSFKKTITSGYVLNGFLVIIGTITMTHFTIIHWPYPTTLPSLFLNTMLPDIFILWGKFLVGKALFDLEVFGYDLSKAKKGVTYRYPHLGWWLIHLVMVSTVYALGNLLWR